MVTFSGGGSAINGGTPSSLYNKNVYYFKETFDSLWVHEIINDLFDAGFTNNNLNMLFLES